MFMSTNGTDDCLRQYKKKEYGADLLVISLWFRSIVGRKRILLQSINMYKYKSMYSTVQGTEKQVFAALVWGTLKLEVYTVPWVYPCGTIATREISIFGLCNIARPRNTFPIKMKNIHGCISNCWAGDNIPAQDGFYGWR